MKPPIPLALTIAGSDSGGGAGIQADLRTFAFHCVHGMSVVTCVTAQNTVGVNRVDALPPEAVVAQLDAVTDDIGVQGLKTGMLLNREIMEAVAHRLEASEKLRSVPLVVDPVMVSRSGVQLIDESAVETLRSRLIPKAAIVTPNRYEAQLLTGMEIENLSGMKDSAERLQQECSVTSVLVKGGGMSGELQGVDVLLHGEEMTVLQMGTISTPNTHGTGCTLSAAIAANLSRGCSIPESVRQAKAYVTEALKFSLDIGKGTGPVGHFFPLCLN
ncbi:bifunctional hydroxymethylpyrimidine kinase/phosphomethylpyrimidine kinase [Roseofilum casamattae]|uniref:Bifunctional hydroxymethylpyrimidine kinase/phosphomethylpyrimidine kinase n=1 Tax=Roseofilum casamattae BLCC-M143 TaxID=3022442 RepID=A0ABT7BUZ7_9CYAN|nr:bifunctional hydroxymethylpyrimidine kinase/phosphomethylpyrimidine kinase [Roseofilum casamattae]MDJ1182329.1 bifunctional hydroxymethylpyrimidine kinase/phosphomethylpyrimidine kinase [Roseofilum casamattae BLCC-M143]